MYLTDKDYDFIYSRSPRICVDVIVKCNDEMLFTKRDIEPYLNHWHIPGGRIKFRETIEEAIRRIALGEIKVDVKHARFIGVCEYLEEVQAGSLRHSISLIHIVELEEKVDGDWFRELPEPFIPEQREAILKYLP